MLLFFRRGPNKYTRNWEDEDAYGKPPVAKPKKPPARKPYRQGEEFPPLGGEGGDGNPLAVQERTKSPVEKKRVQEEKYVFGCEGCVISTSLRPKLARLVF